jgi:hypothetical protein
MEDVCRTTERRTGRKEDNMQNNGEENKQGSRVENRYQGGRTAEQQSREQVSRRTNSRAAE